MTFEVRHLNLVEFQFLDEDIFRDFKRPAKSPTTLVIIKDCLKGGSMSVDEDFIPPWVPQVLPLEGISKEGVRISVEGPYLGFEPLPTDVYYDPLASGLDAVVILLEKFQISEFYLD